MQSGADFADWVKCDPPPNVHDLAIRFGSYKAITPEAWAEYDRAMEAWQERRKLRLQPK
jgi:hypothetical protein